MKKNKLTQLKSTGQEVFKAISAQKHVLQLLTCLLKVIWEDDIDIGGQHDDKMIKNGLLFCSCYANERKLTLLLLLTDNLPPLCTLIVRRDEECETLKEMKG